MAGRSGSTLSSNPPASASVPTARCSCGSPLPWHLAELGLTAHICRCEKRYAVVDGRFVEDGREANPFAAGRA